MKSEYYALRGWDEKTGRQTGAALKSLGWHDIAAYMEKTK
jgi:hypothetical protein